MDAENARWSNFTRGKGKAEISDFIAFETKLRFKKDLRPNEQGKFLFGPQKTNEGVRSPIFTVTRMDG